MGDPPILGRPGAPAAALLGLLAAAAPGVAADPPPLTVYEFATPLAPVCVDGSFSLDLVVAGEFVEGTLAATTDSRGRVTGTWTTGARVLEAKGKVKYRSGLNEIRLRLKDASARLRLEGALEAAGFAGVSRGKGDLAPGESDFHLDTGPAGPSVASVSVVLPPDGGGRLVGEGTVHVCGDPVAVRAVRTAGKNLRLAVRGGGFRWVGIGPLAGDPGSVPVSFTAKGFGAKVAGTGMDLATTPPPSGLAYADPAPLYEEEEAAAPNVPTVGGGPVLTWSVNPELPEGLVLDPATGVVSGTPEDPAPASLYTVTAANLAGSTTTGLDISVRINRAYSFAPEGRTLTDDDLRHFLGRTHFGVRQAELDALKAAGLPAYLDDQLDFRSGTAVEAAAFAELVNDTDPPGFEGGFPSGAQLSRWWTRIVVETDRPMQESIALFWHDRIPIAWDVLGGGSTHFFPEYADLFRHGGAGNLRDLLVAMARNRGMLVYLDGIANTRTAPNENFAREFWELFTLGVDNGYTQADIEQAAKAFTGYRLRLDTTTQQYYTEFSTNRHDPGPKTFFGATIPGQNVTDDFEAVVDITLANRPVAEFLTKKIFERFAYESPPDSLVQEMAATLRGSNWELKPFLSALFQSEAFFSKRSRTGIVKGPLQYAAGFIRSTGLQVRINVLDQALNVLGHRPGLPPTVNGWPTGTLWLPAASMVNRTNLVYTIVGDTVRQRSVGIEVAAILPPVEVRTAEAVVDTLSTLLRVRATAAERDRLLLYLNTQRLSDGTVVASPFDGADQTHLDERVRGLLYVLAQHPSYHVE